MKRLKKIKPFKMNGQLRIIKQLKIIDEISLATSVLSEDNVYLTKEFRTNDPAFDFFIKKEALYEKNTGYGVTYLIADVSDENNIILVAYYTIATNSIPYRDIQIDDNEKVDEKTCGLSAIEIKMFAVNKYYQNSLYHGKLVSNIIMEYIINEINELSTTIIGTKTILLNSVKSAKKFYRRNNFHLMNKYMKPLYDACTFDSIPMYLRLHK